MNEPTKKPAKDIGDAHEHLGRDGLRAALENATAAALAPAEIAAPKSALSDKTPPNESQGGDFADNADFDTEETEPAAPFPLECLPGAAGDMAREVAATALVPETLTGMAVLGILSAAIGAGLEVNSGGDRRTRGNLYLMPVAKSGTGKGQSFGAIAAPFNEREAARVEEWRREDRPQASADKKATEARLAQLTKDASKVTAKEEKAALVAELRELETELDRAQRALTEPAWSTEQATKEAIEYLFSMAAREQVASLSAEARGAVDVLMGRYREATDESIFLAGYSGDAVKIHRKGSPPIVLHGPCLAVLWMLQPDKVREMLESPAMTESGLLPRFLIADTKAEPQEEPEERRGIAEPIKTAWAALIHALLDEYHEPNAKARVIETERAAAALLRDYRNQTVRRHQRGGDLEDVASYPARWAENAWRLCVVLHAAEHGEDAWRVLLSAATAAKAVKLMEWFSKQQLQTLAAGREDRLAKRLDRLKEVLTLKTGQAEKLRELERHHALTDDEVRKLAAKFPGVVTVERIMTGGAGRPSEVAKLLPTRKAA